jgi:hypothetical protein
VVKHKFVEVSTFKINNTTNKLEEFQRMSREAEQEAYDDDAYNDPRMGKGGKERKAKGGFQVRANSLTARTHSSPPIHPPWLLSPSLRPP